MDSDTVTIIATAAFAVSEALALIPKVKANGIFHFVTLVLKAIAGK